VCRRSRMRSRSRSRVSRRSRSGMCGRSSSRMRCERRMRLWLGSSLGSSRWRGLCRDLGFSLPPRSRCGLCRDHRLFYGQGLRVAAIGLGVGGLVDLGRSNVLCLEAGRSRMLLARGCLLLGSGGVLNATRPAVVGHMIGVGNDAPLHNSPVNVGRVDDGLIHVHDCGVIGKGVAAPLAAGKADASVAAAVVHAAVVADVAAPITVMKPVVAAGPAPVVGGPQRALIGSRNPGAGHPEVVSIVV
jgi:hypothetical protein